MSEEDKKFGVIDEYVDFDPNYARAKNARFVVTPKIIEEIEHFGALGMSLNQIAIMLGISKATLCRIRKRDKTAESVDTALVRGRYKALAKVSHNLFSLATESNNVAAIKYFLSNRYPEMYSEKSKVDHTSSDGSVIMPTNITIQAKGVTTSSEDESAKNAGD